MAMLRAFSTRRSRHGYERLLEVEGEEQQQQPVANMEAQLKRARSVPARVFGLSRSRKLGELALPETSQPKKPSSSNKVTKSHPLFSLFYGSRKKKTTAKPEFARYIEYLKEGGMWDMSKNTPVLYYK
ncbi:hypothetical protein COLO4_22043 [Corchorus olitorius]|uniref:Uncharacterized protein n=1 Tax=Corchorus olitorius TaxID=93759 RepID=A0A1R3IPF3_9ROSI|nr:hypothetical protein COLO4_22043 [Corchorus olitorius]